MKMVKKILLGLAAGAVAIGMISCKNTDDTKKAIEGSGSNYSIDYTEEDGQNYRAYKSTAMNHAGALVKITFDNPENDNYSKMGVIFDLHDNDKDKNAKDFYIIGLAGSSSLNFYVSKFTNVTDLQADNFGTKLSENPAKEEVIYDTTNKSTGIGSITRPAAVDGKVSYYVYFKEFMNKTGDTSKGYFEYAVYSMDDETAAKVKTIVNSTEDGKNAAAIEGTNGVTKLYSDKIADAFDLKTNTDTQKKYLPQNQLAVYVNVIANKTLKGTWKFLEMYKEAEEIVE